jgi:hypothetical protein
VLDSERGSIALLEGREGKEDLNHGSHVAAVIESNKFARIRGKRKVYAPVAEVLQACQVGPKDGLEGIPCLVREREIKVEVMLDLLVAVV